MFFFLLKYGEKEEKKALALNLVSVEFSSVSYTRAPRTKEENEKKEGKNRIHMHPFYMLCRAVLCVFYIARTYRREYILYTESSYVSKKKEMTNSKAEQSRAEYTFMYIWYI